MRAIRVLALVLGWISAAPPVCGVRAPNFVFLMADDLGYGDLSCQGARDVRTPNLDRLAREGVRLTDFYANGPVCTPTRAALLTGRYPQRLGLEGALPPEQAHRGLPPGEPTLATLLRQRGYRTALSGKWHLGYTPERAPNAHGFQRFFGLLGGNHDYFTHRDRNGKLDLWRDTEPVQIEGYSTHLITREAIRFLEAMREEPFFLYVAFNAPHWPIQGPQDAHRQITLRGWTQGDRKTYVQMVEALDAGVGEILAALQRWGLDTNTLVVFTSDNGGDRFSSNAPFSQGKGTLGEGGLRVPCIARWPGHIPPGSVSAQAGITMDWTETMLALAGPTLPSGRWLDGCDLLPVLGGARRPFKRTLFWRRVGTDGIQTHRAVRDGDWKLIESRRGAVQLFDLSRDPAEKTNLATNRPAQVKQLRKRLDRWEADVGPVTAP